MAKEIELPDGSIGEFPDSMSDEDIKGVLRRKFPVQQQQPAPAPQQLNPGMHPVAEQVGKAGRVLVNALASPAVLASRGLDKANQALARATGTQALPMADLDAEINSAMDKLGIAKLDPSSMREQLTLGAAKSAPAFALPASLPLQVAGNAAIAGAQAPAGEEGKEAAIGGALGAGGHVLARTLGGIVRPTAEAQQLIDKGVALTPGQAAGAGSMLNRFEQSLSSNPLAGAPIRKAQRRALEEANAAAAQSVVNLVDDGVKLGVPPREAIERTRDAISEAYHKSLSGMEWPASALKTDLTAAMEHLPTDLPLTPPKTIKKIENYLKQRMGPLLDRGGNLSGDELKQIDAELGQMARQLASSANATDKVQAPAWREVQSYIRTTMESAAATPEQHILLSSANNAYRQLLALERALLDGADAFTPRQLARQLDKAGIKGTDLNRTSDAMGKVLPNAVNDSGTTERLLTTLLPTMLMGGGAGAHQLGFETVGSGMLAAGALGSRPGARFMTGALPGQRALAEALRRAGPTAARKATEGE